MIEQGDRRELEHKVAQIVQTLLGSKEVSMETILLGQRGILDSVTAVALIVRLEQTFEISFDDEDLTLDNLSSVENIVSFLDKII
ncbi:acyl carrier protein [Paenibacillus motobuensis]|uniref:acyl carrier protein n=1 Tax=Paenibacillus TaxID=44249 RepID=UPI00203CC7FC|nr:MULTISPECIES: acyl carrier protein [Paenibacillus]MCM3039660.1 acyl carrier protein [Paenibacillus lutimineralis]MCM3646764.1 acyl carrier protein [Paenibacillus motobuensis]